MSLSVDVDTGLGLQVLGRAGQWLPELWAFGDQVEEFGSQRPVPSKQVLDLGYVQTRAVRGELTGVEGTEVPVGSGQRNTFGTGLGDRAFQPVNRGVDGVPGHHPVCRVLTPRDDRQPAHGAGDRVFTRQRAGRV